MRQQINEMIEACRTFEGAIGHQNLIDWSRLPKTIKVRRGFRIYTYRLEHGKSDDNAYLSYSDDSKPWGDSRKVLLHYEESTLKECISKTWRSLAENRVKL